MTKEENVQRLKNEALNKIRELYNPRTNQHEYRFDEMGVAESLSLRVEEIIRQLEVDLRKIKKSNGKSK